LTTRLTINWSLFTRNTIWWSITWTSGKILLPGWQEARTDEDKNLALYYDLNNVRLWWNKSCDADDYTILIKYNSMIQTNPPKGFSR
jgi:hypothetical protein